METRPDMRELFQEYVEEIINPTVTFLEKKITDGTITWELAGNRKFIEALVTSWSHAPGVAIEMVLRPDQEDEF